MVPPKKQEDALLRKRIEKDKAKEFPSRLEQRISNLKHELAAVETQAEENRQRVLVLQSEWQALYDTKLERTRIRRLKWKSVQEEEEGDGDMGDVAAMDESDCDNQEDPEGFKGVLSRCGRKKQRVNKADAAVEGGNPSGQGIDGTVLDSIDHNTLRRHIFQGIPAEQFVSVRS